jgi:hypothetical protein
MGGIMGEVLRTWKSGVRVFLRGEWEQGVGRRLVQVSSTFDELCAAPHRLPLPVGRGEGDGDTCAMTPLIRPRFARPPSPTRGEGDACATLLTLRNPSRLAETSKPACLRPLWEKVAERSEVG